jgi:ribosomal protein S18 acetylase RimI-like enzyme
MNHKPSIPHPITYRKATLSDIPTLVDFRIRFLSEFPATIEGKDISSLKARLADYFCRAIPSGELITYLAERDGVTVGCSGLVRWQFIPGFALNSENRGYIFNVYTVPEARRQGIAASMVALLIEEAMKLGIGSLSLHSRPEAESIYRKAGFTDDWDKDLRLKLE